ncbi:MAG TPA: DMT family transporter [Myxococcota bacterium]|nr:DMT family transporter [Myxococcota bacterium]HRY95208.1 DMT family transporter [Myxococcota bacterium]HSA20521.1 DMT family transporter [Myxococcota bacterium]
MTGAAVASLGELAALGTATCWTVTALAFEAAGRRVGSLAVNLLRLALAAGIYSLFGLANRGLALPTDASAHAWLWLSLSGLVGFTLGDLCLFRALVLVGARLSMLIMALVPPLTALLGWVFLGEALTWLDGLGMLLTLVGVGWVVLERRPPDPRGADPRARWSGLALALGGAAGQAVGLVLSKHGMGEYDAFAASHIRVLAGLGGFVLLFTACGLWGRLRPAFKDRRAMAQLGLGALFGPFLGVSLSLLAVQHTQAGVAATLMALVPVLVIPAAWLLRREPVTLRALAGACIAVAGSAFLFL